MRYGEKEIKEFDVENMEIWPNDAKNDYIIKITLPELCVVVRVRAILTLQRFILSICLINCG